MPEPLNRCPACRARLAETAVCPRCGCDFSLVRQAMTQAARLLERALCSLAVGDRAAARRQVEASLSLHRQRLAQAIRNFLDADEDHAESGPAEPQLRLPSADLQAVVDPAGVREDQCVNRDAEVLPM